VKEARIMSHGICSLKDTGNKILFRIISYLYGPVKEARIMSRGICSLKDTGNKILFRIFRIISYLYGPAGRSLVVRGVVMWRDINIFM
jgi:hypothetical protein